jgi:hypothetical protein
MSKMYTEVDSSTILRYDMYIHATNEYGTTAITPMISVNVDCGLGSALITE